MTIENARELTPLWAAEDPVRVYEPKKQEKRAARKQPEKRRAALRLPEVERLKKKYGIMIIAAAAFTLYTVILSGCVEARAEKRVRQEMAVAYAAQLEQYKAEQARAVQAEHFLSGEASREAFLNQEIDAAARLCAKMSNDTQKGGIICNALARVMNKNYPDTMRGVVEQPEQWMFYDEGNKFSAHDREIAEKILRDYYEKGIIPNGLTEDFVYGSWSESDYVLRNTWDFGSSTRTWRWQG